MSRMLLTDSTLITLANNKQVAEALPCLQNLAVVRPAMKSGCSKCQKKKLERQTDPAKFAAARRCLYEASTEAKALVKRQLRAEQLVVYLNDPTLPARVVL